MNREVLSSPGIPEDLEKQAQRKKEFVERLSTREMGVVTPELRQFLEKVDFEVLRSLFAVVGERCGINSADLNFLTRENVVSLENARWQRMMGMYDSLHNVIMMSDNRSVKPKDYYDEREDVDEEVRAHSIENYGSTDLHLLKRMIHEEAHAVGRNLCIEPEDDVRHDPASGREVVGVSDLVSGYHRYGLQHRHSAEGVFGESWDVFKTMNEGIVEKFSREILTEYLSKTHWPEEDVAAYQRTLKERPEYLSYASEVDLIERAMKRLAKKNQQSEKVVWEALVRGLMEGEDLENEEIKALFRESFGPDFLKELSEMDPEQGDESYSAKLSAFIKKYEL